MILSVSLSLSLATCGGDVDDGDSEENDEAGCEDSVRQRHGQVGPVEAECWDNDVPIRCRRGIVHLLVVCKRACDGWIGRSAVDDCRLLLLLLMLLLLSLLACDSCCHCVSLLHSRHRTTAGALSVNCFDRVNGDCHMRSIVER